jgi:hypothetical protein
MKAADSMTGPRSNTENGGLATRALIRVPEPANDASFVCVARQLARARERCRQLLLMPIGP